MKTGRLIVNNPNELYCDRDVEYLELYGEDWVPDRLKFLEMKAVPSLRVVRNGGMSPLLATVGAYARVMGLEELRLARVRAGGLPPLVDEPVDEPDAEEEAAPCPTAS